MGRPYTAEQRAEAVALAASIGPLKAAKTLGLPKSTVSLWLHKPAAAPVIAAAEASIADRLRTAHAEALQSVMDGLHDPRTRLGDRATALRVLGEQLALAEGRATQNIETHTYGDWSADNDAYQSATPEARAQADEFLKQLLDEVMMGQAALKLAGATDSGFDIDGLTVRANIAKTDVYRIKYLLTELEKAQEAGVPAWKIIAALTAKRITP